MGNGLEVFNTLDKLTSPGLNSGIDILLLTVNLRNLNTNMAGKASTDYWWFHREILAPCHRRK